jgi:hypothetical protein
MSRVTEKGGITYGKLGPGDKLTDLAASNGHGKLPKRQVLVHAVMAFIRRYVVMSNEQLLVTALWVVHTYAIDSAEQTPYLAINSVEKACGKTRLLETLNLLCAKPWTTSSPSEATVYRNIEAKKPTMLLDEVDTIFSPRTADKYEGLRALLNNGNRRGAKVPRCVGPTNKIVEFDTYCAKALAGIGTLPDTVADRAIPIRLQRKTREEKTAQFRRREVEPLGKKLSKRIEKWAAANSKALEDARPAMPDELDDRDQDGCEALVAIADLLDCGPQAREALVSLLAGERLDSEETVRIQLLRDIRTVFNKKRDGQRHNKLSTESLLKRLNSDPKLAESGWGGYYHRGLASRDLAKFLHQYGISSQNVRIGEKVLRGYTRDSFYEAWKRYL